MSAPIDGTVKKQPQTRDVCLKILRPLLASAVVVLLLFALQRIGVQRLLAPWTTVSAGLLGAAAALQALSYLARAARLAQAETAIGWRRLGSCLRIVMIHNASNILLPLRSGELSLIWLLRRRYGIEPLHGTGTLLLLRLSDLLVLASCATLALLLQMQASAVTAVSTALALALLAPWLLFQVLRALRRRAVDGGRLARLVCGMPDAAPGFAMALLWSWLGWALKLAGLAMLFASLSGHGLALGALVAIAGDLSTVLPVHAPAGLGTYEAAALAAAAPWVRADATLAAAVIGLHGFLLAMSLALGLLASIAELLVKRGA